VVTPSITVRGLLNMTAIAVYDAQVTAAAAKAECYTLHQGGSGRGPGARRNLAGKRAFRAARIT